MSLNARQQRFVDEYLVDLNATAAAIRAGYSAKTARSQASDLLTNPNIQAAVAAGRVELARKADVSKERWINELRRVGFGDLRGTLSWGPDGVQLRPSDELSDDDAAAIAEVSESTTESGGSLKVKRHDKMRALEMLGRHFGWFDDKMTVGGQLQVEVVDYSRAKDHATA